MYRVFFMKKRIICILLAIILCLTAIAIRISRYYSISCDIYANTGIKGLLNYEINNYISNKLNGINLSPIEIKHSSDGTISEICVDTKYINKFAAETAIGIFDIVIKSNPKFGIPLGNTVGIDYLSGKGPKIDVKIVPVSSVEYEMHSELLESSINQTLHRVSLNFNITIECIAPFHKSDIEIKNTIIIAETLIVGRVPQILLPS